MSKIKSTPITVDLLDAFTLAYLGCCLWAESDDDGDALDDRFGICDFTTEALALAFNECQRFQAENQRDLARYARHARPARNPDEAAGHDFWLTRNGHGSGFWARDWLPKALRQRLSDAADNYGHCYATVGDDDLIHLS